MNHNAIATALIALLSGCPDEPGPGKLQETGLHVELDCHDGLDNDGDYQIDEQDADCWGTHELCLNGMDDDDNGLTDCFDPTCMDFCGEDCGNGLDDDGDGLTDCGDPGCAWTCGPQAYTEDCDNGSDDDGDGLVDCEDGFCADKAPCAEICDTPDLDDDNDGLVDCDDDDCWGSLACLDAGVSFTARVLGARGFWQRFEVSTHEGTFQGSARAARAVDVSGSLVVGTGASAVGCSWWVAQLDIGFDHNQSRYGFDIDPDCPVQTSYFLQPVASADGSTMMMLGGSSSAGLFWYIGGPGSPVRWRHAQNQGYQRATYHLLDILPVGSTFAWPLDE